MLDIFDKDGARVLRAFLRRALAPFCLGVLTVALCACHKGDRPRAMACPAFAHVDRTALPTHLNDDPAGERLDDMWTRWSGDRPAIAWRTPAPDATLRLMTSDGMVAEPAAREIAGRRSARGWEIYARKSDLTGPSMIWGPWAPVRLSSSAASRLDALLADPCLWDAPSFLDGEVRLKNGRYDSRPDGPSTVYEVSIGEHRWRGWHFSWTVGVPGQVRGVLLGEAFGSPQYGLDEIGPDGWIDRP